MTERHSQLDEHDDGQIAGTSGIDHEKVQRGTRLLLEVIGESPDSG